MRIHGSDDNYNFHGFWGRKASDEHYASARHSLVINSGYRITLKH